MEFLKKLFGDGALTFDELAAKITEAKLNVVDISDGGYVSRNKYVDDVNAQKQMVTELKSQIAQRDTDMDALKKSLETAQADSTKLAEAQSALESLQTKYADDKTAFETKLAQQAYEFKVREKANEIKFSSKSAKTAFIKEAMDKGFKMDGDVLMGYEDFLAKYKTDDPTAFAVEEAPKPKDDPKPPIVIGGTGGAPSGKKMSLSEMMRAKNDNPNLQIG